MAQIKALTQHNFDAQIAQARLVVVDFCAKWCAPCTVFHEVMGCVAEQEPDVVFASVDIEQEEALAQEFAIRSVPSVMIIRNQAIVYAESGALSEGQLIELIAKAKAI